MKNGLKRNIQNFPGELNGEEISGKTATHDNSSDNGVVHDRKKSGGRKVDIKDNEHGDSIHDILLKSSSGSHGEDFFFYLYPIADCFCCVIYDGNQLAATALGDSEHSGKIPDVVDS